MTGFNQVTSLGIISDGTASMRFRTRSAAETPVADTMFSIYRNRERRVAAAGILSRVAP